MKNYRKHIDDFFREKLGRYTETPPPDVWDELDGRLDTLVPSAPVAPYRWLWHVAIVSLILTLSVSVARKIAGNGNQEPTTTQLAQNTATSQTATSTAAGPSDQATTHQTVAPSEKSGSQIASAPAAVAGNTGSESTEAGNEAAQGSQADNGNELVKGNTLAGKLTTKAKTKRKARSTDNTSRLAHQQKASGRKRTANRERTLPETSFATAPVTEEKRIAVNADDNNNALTDKPVVASVAINNKTTANASAITKKDSAASAKATENAANTATRRGPQRFELGIKAGYEGGFNNDAARKAVVAPYLQYNLSPKMSVMVQPAIKYANISTRNVASESYYSANEDGKITQEPTTKSIIVSGGSIDTFYTTKYTYTQTHDSIVKSYTHGGSYTEFELPILLKYALCPGFSVYGGVNLLYSRLTGLAENTYTKNNILRSFDTTITTSSASPSILPNASGIIYSGTPLSDYKKLVSPQGNILSVGYMLGFTYTMHDRWLFDVLAEQTPVKPNTVAGYNTNAALASPYFRLSVGYKFIRPRAASTDHGSE